MPKQIKIKRKQQPKRATRSAAPRPPPSGGVDSGAVAEHHDTLVGLVDPFSSLAANARYPDAGAGKTLTFQSRTSATVTSNANGGFGLAVNPKASFFTLNAASTSTTLATWASLWTTDTTSNLLNTYGRAYRPTSFGIRIDNLLSATDSAGYMVLAKGGIPPALGSSTTFNPTNFSSWDVHPMRHGGEWHVIGVPQSSSAYDFKLVGDYNQNINQGDSDWETIYVAGFGTKISTAVLYVEVFINYEYVPLEDAAIACLAIPQPVMNSGLLTAVNHMQSSQPSSHTGSKSAVSNFLKRESKKALVKHVIPFLAKKGSQLLL